MLYKTRAVILYQMNYSDVYTIVHVYTEAFGPVSYLTAKSKSKTTRVPKSFFHPLAVVDLEVEHQNLREIQRIKEAKPHFPLFSILTEPVKSTICIFLAEVMAKVLKDKQPDALLFDYLLQSIRILELSENNYANFHLVFLIRLSRFIGFYPDNSEYRKGMVFDLQNGIFIPHKPYHIQFLNPDESEVFHHLLRMSYENMSQFQFARNERKDILYRILEYYRLHLSSFSEIKSLEILHEVFG
ncbi:MAG: DNA repair protein RecO C-terminal domain-containing protein [Candidatus Symbiothrix sp.]|nr:DNA repair protein RecO C-terminal domain-containing protein [Candidatus Symbiothrix sp.]